MVRVFCVRSKGKLDDIIVYMIEEPAIFTIGKGEDIGATQTRIDLELLRQIDDSVLETAFPA